MVTNEVPRGTMEASICSQDKNVNLYFVRPAEGTSSPCLLAAYQACERFQSKWISADKCLQLKPTKQDVFVCDPFEGKAFAHLTSGFKCVIVGPRCILSCLHRSEPIPQVTSPIHNTAMRSLIITTTGFVKEKKEELKTLVERMAGIYSADYHLGVTHLVANEVGSKKYQVAVEQEIPIMTGEWVSAVWQAVTKDHTQHILATDERFLSLTCPVLYGMVICVSQLDRATKLALKGIIEENGGTYAAMLEMSKTSVLIVSAPEGEKYSHACKWRIKCLTQDWIYDSVQRGHALTMDGYEVKKQKLSTPVSSQANTTLPPEVSQCSAINGESALLRTTVDETTGDANETLPKERKQTLSKEVNLGLEAIENLDLQEAQRASLFLDGCKIFLSGFTNTHLEKLRRILNFGGATRFNQLTEAVSHMVIGKPVEEHLSLVREWSTRPHLVYARWVTESIKLKRPADEAPFTHPLEEEEAVEEIKKPQHSASHSTSTTHCNGDVPLEEDEVLRQYLKPGQTSSVTLTPSAALTESQDHRATRIFLNKTFTVSGYTQELEETLTEVVEDAGGQVVPLSHSGRVHYSLVTSEGRCHPNTEEVVSHYFLEDCVNAKRLLPVEYYHVPLILPGDVYPLEECCITISTYTKNERLFLENLATLLGARSQEMFAKKPNPSKGIVSSTHLVCPLPTGNKYQAAKKWGVPSVSADWLIECSRAARKVPEADFAVDQTERPKLARKKIFRDHLAAMLERRQVEDGRESPSPGSRRNNRSGSLTPSPDGLLKAHAVAEIHTVPRLSSNHNEEDVELSMPTPRPDQPKASCSTTSKMREIGDSFNNSQPPAASSEAHGREFYRKFYEDIKETMRKYKRKNPLQLQEGKSKNSCMQENQEMNTQSRREQTEAEEGEEGDGPLKGVVVCSSRKFMDRWKEMSQVVTELGGQFLHSYCPEVTHFLYQGRSNDMNREFRKAKQDGKLVVAPDWLWMCQEKGTKVDEELFPHTHNPNMSLPLTGSMRSPKKKHSLKRKYPEEGEEAEEEPSQHQETQGSEESKPESESDQEKEKLSKQLEEIGALAQVSGKKTGLGRGRSKPPGEWCRPATARHVDIETQPMSGEEPESQGTAITWEDPVEREARLRLRSQLGESTEDLMEEGQNQQESAEEEAKKKEKARQDKREEEAASACSEAVDDVDKPSSMASFVFVMVGMSEEKRKHYSKLVQELGATVCLGPTFTPEITHLVAETLSRSERTLAAIASGKWVLHDSYLDHSFQAGHFLQEELYAWGNPAAQHLPTLQLENTRAQLAKAAWRWKCAMNGSGGRSCQLPFQHMVALVHSSKDRVGAFTRMINAGGGEVVTARPPFRDLQRITHFFVEMDKATEKVDLEVFVAKGIPCLKPIFINNYLIMDPLPEEEDHYISQYKDLLLTMSSHNQSGAKRLRKE